MLYTFSLLQYCWITTRLTFVKPPPSLLVLLDQLLLIYNFLCSALKIFKILNFLSFFFWPLYCVFFELRLLITSLVTSNFSWSCWPQIMFIWTGMQLNVFRRMCDMLDWKHVTIYNAEVSLVVIYIQYWMFMKYSAMISAVGGNMLQSFYYVKAMWHFSCNRIIAYLYTW